MYVLRCDRCRREIEDHERRYELQGGKRENESDMNSYRMNLMGGRSSVDLCENCMFELWGWLKMENHTRRVSDPMEDDCK